MVHGTYPVERINLNEDTFWSGPDDTAVPEVPEGLLAEAREQVRAGRYVEAGRTLRATQGADAEALQPVGDLPIEFVGGPDTASGSATPDSYRRSLNLRDGVAAVERVAAGRVTRHEVIASVERQVLAVRLETDDPDGLRVNLSFATQADTRFALRCGTVRESSGRGG